MRLVANDAADHPQQPGSVAAKCGFWRPRPVTSLAVSTAVTPTRTPNEDAATGNTSGYRHDLDGLRGVAIALVAIFHVWFGLLCRPPACCLTDAG